MANRVKTTVIEKKTKSGGVVRIDYAKVVDRLNEFRKEHAQSKIKTDHKILNDGAVIFKAYIWKDKTDFVEALKNGTELNIALYTADAEGTAKSTDTGEKSFEKLETISVGRALALLGYAVTGEIASAEEMDRFNGDKIAKKETELETGAKRLRAAKTMDGLKVAYMSLPSDQRSELTGLKDELKAKLTKGAK